MPCRSFFAVLILLFFPEVPAAEETVVEPVSVAIGPRPGEVLESPQVRRGKGLFGRKAGSAPAPLPVPPGARPRPLVPIPEHWIFFEEASDEFNAPSLDLEKWRADVPSWGTWSWDARNAAQSGGRLALTMVHEPHERKKRTLHYKSGIVRSEAEVVYGYFEARIRGCDRFPGVSPAFWLYSLGEVPGRVNYCEVDVVELQQDSGVGKRPALMDFNLHSRVTRADGTKVEVGPAKNPGLCKHQWRSPWDPRKDFHVYSALVTAKRITWFVDGRQVASAENLNWHLPMRVVLSLGLRATFVDDRSGEKVANAARSTGRGFPTTMEVDYVRIWTPTVR